MNKFLWWEHIILSHPMYSILCTSSVHRFCHIYERDCRISDHVKGYILYCCCSLVFLLEINIYFQLFANVYVSILPIFLESLLRSNFRTFDFRFPDPSRNKFRTCANLNVHLYYILNCRAIMLIEFIKATSTRKSR